MVAQIKVGAMSSYAQDADETFKVTSNALIVSFKETVLGASSKDFIRFISDESMPIVRPKLDDLGFSLQPFPPFSALTGSYISKCEADPSFKNPRSVALMRSSFGIDNEYASTSSSVHTAAAADDWNYKNFGGESYTNNDRFVRESKGRGMTTKKSPGTLSSNPKQEGDNSNLMLSTIKRLQREVDLDERGDEKRSKKDISSSKKSKDKAMKKQNKEKKEKKERKKRKKERRKANKSSRIQSKSPTSSSDYSSS